MSAPQTDHSIEIHVPDAETEQTFLLLAVEAAIKKYRERHRGGPLPAGPYEQEIPIVLMA